MSAAHPPAPAVRPRQRSLGRAFGKVAICLAALQAARAAVSFALSSAFPPGGDVDRFQALNAIAFIVVGLAAIALAKPTSETLGLSLTSAPGIERAWYVIIGAVLALMVAASIYLNPGQAGIALHFVVVVPAFEEMLFRGYVWATLAEAVPDWRSGLVAWLGSTLLFCLWHLGYADTLARNPMGADLLTVLAWKLAIGAALGLATGFLRWRTGRIVGPFVLHAFWNLMAP